MWAQVPALPAQGRFRCPVNCRKLMTGPTGSGRREKQRIRESGGDISAQRTQPRGCARTTGGNASKQRIGREGKEVAQVFVNTTETTRPRRVATYIRGRLDFLAVLKFMPLRYDLAFRKVHESRGDTHQYLPGYFFGCRLKNGRHFA